MPVTSADVRNAADLVLPHRVRRQPLMDIAENVQSPAQKGNSVTISGKQP